MFPGNIEAVMREQQKDLLKEAEKQRLIKSLLQPDEVQPNPTVRQRFGMQLIRWGEKISGTTSRSIPSKTCV
jgi:hypothetical protein